MDDGECTAMRTIVETPSFAKDADVLMGEASLESLKDNPARDPKIGDLIKDTGGFRKLRGRRSGSGQRGGVRVYYYPTKQGAVYLVACIPKADDSPLTKEQCKTLKDLALEFDTSNAVPPRRNRP
jgi:hypothetical protein